MFTYRFLEERDLDTRVDWMNNPLIYQSMHYTPPVSIEKTIKWFHDNRNNHSRVDLVLEEDGEIVVMNGLTGLDPVTKKVESYTIVNPYTKGRGYGTTSLCLKCGYAFDIWKINKVWAYIDGDNIASQKMCFKVGWKEEGRMRNELFKDGVLLDRCYFGILPDDFNRDLYNTINLNCNNLLLP